MGRGWFFLQEKGESRYEKTIPDRSPASGATVPPAGPRREPQQARISLGYGERLPIAENGRIVLVKTRDVDWIEADGNYVHLHVGSRGHDFRETLTNLEHKLNPRDFLPIHRSAIVNVHRIKEIRPWFGGYHVVVLENGSE
jgi:two-component system LytT family response regulator